MTTLQKQAQYNIVGLIFHSFIYMENEVKLSSGAVAATPDQVSASTAEMPATSPVIEKKKGGGGKCVLIGCIVLLLCCCVSAVGGFLLFQAGGAAVVSNQTTQDTTLTRLASASEVDDIIADMQADLETGVPVDEDTVAFNFSEEEVLALLISNMNLDATPGAVGVKIEGGKARLEMELSALAEAVNAANQSSDTEISVSGLKGAYARIDFTEATNGKGLVVSDISLGNGVADMLMKNFMIESLSSVIDKALEDSFGTGLQGLSLKNGTLTLLLDPEFTVPVEETE